MVPNYLPTHSKAVKAIMKDKYTSHFQYEAKFNMATKIWKSVKISRGIIFRGYHKYPKGPKIARNRFISNGFRDNQHFQFPRKFMTADKI